MKRLKWVWIAAAIVVLPILAVYAIDRLFMRRHAQTAKTR